MLHTGCLAARAGRARIRLGRDLLAALGRVAAGRRLAGAACAAARSPTGCRRTRMVECDRRSSQVQAKKGAPKCAQARGTEAVPAPNTTSSSTDADPVRLLCHGWQPHDVTQLIALLDGVPAVRGAIGRPRRRPERLIADPDYDHDKYRRLLWQRGVKPMIARRQTVHGSGLGRDRWVIERTFAWLHNFKRLVTATNAAPTRTGCNPATHPFLTGWARRGYGRIRGGGVAPRRRASRRRRAVRRTIPAVPPTV